MTTSSLLAWFGEASIVLGLVVLLVLLARRAARGRLSAAWTYALWLAIPVALLASLSPWGLITVPRGLILAPMELLTPSADPSDAAIVAAGPDVASGTVGDAGAEEPVWDLRLASRLLFAGWLIGFLGFAIVHLGAQSRLHRTVVARARRPRDDERAALSAAAAGTTLAPERDFRFTDQIASPAACGFFRPVVLLPQDFLARYAPGERRVMVLHEAEHVRARHLGHRLLARLLCGVFWFHPLAWLAERAFIADQELACDQGALGRDPAIRPRTYAETLLKIARHITECGLPRSAASVSLITANELKERTSMLERHASLGRTRAAGLLALAVVAATSAIAGLSAGVAAGAQDVETESARAAQIRLEELRVALAQAEADVAARRGELERTLRELEAREAGAAAAEDARRALDEARARFAELDRAADRARVARLEEDARARAETEQELRRRRAAHEQALRELDLGLANEAAVDRARVMLREAEDMVARRRAATAPRVVAAAPAPTAAPAPPEPSAASGPPEPAAAPAPAAPIAVEEQIGSVRRAAENIEVLRAELERTRQEHEVGLVNAANVRQVERELTQAQAELERRSRAVEAATGRRLARADPVAVEAQLRAEIDAVEVRLQSLRLQLEELMADRAAAEALDAEAEN